MLNKIKTLLPLLALPLLISGCDTLTGPGGWFGDKVKPPLPGERISILAHDKSLTPDPRAADTEILLPRPTPNKSWPQAGGYANHAMHHVQIADNISEAWDVNIGQGNSKVDRLNASPVAADGKVFAMDADHQVTAYNAEDGDEIWEMDLLLDDEDDGHIPGGIAYNKGKLFATAGFGVVYAMDANTGEPLWKRKLDGPIRVAPTVRGGRVFVITVENKLYALSAYTGETLWSYEAIAETASLLGGAAPAVGQGVVVAPFSSGELVALKVTNGRVLWSDSLTAVRRIDTVSAMAHIRARPIIDRDLVIAISHGGIMAAIDLRTGRRIWEKGIGGLENLWVAGDYVFTITNDGDIAAIGRGTGRVHWVTSLPRWEDEEDKEDLIIWWGPILVSDRLVVAGSHGEALALSPYTGEVLGMVELPDGITITPIVADGAVYFLTEDADLIAWR